jgi:hypothetical protein
LQYFNAKNSQDLATLKQLACPHNLDYELGVKCWTVRYKGIYADTLDVANE